MKHHEADPADDYVIRFAQTVAELDASAWNALLERQPLPTPFMRHEYLLALETSSSATPSTGWTPRFATLHERRGGELRAAAPLYLKPHSYGEYVFDWAWANAYAQHGLPYYPKAVIAVPFTPVPGSRLLAQDAPARQALLQAIQLRCRAWGLSSAHLLFGHATDLAAAASQGWMSRQHVQFHWSNRLPVSAGGSPDGGTRYPSFEAFLANLQQEKRKKIRQERRKVAEAGVQWRWARGDDIRPEDWDFFYACYAQTYREHGNPPYLQPGFFEQTGRTLGTHWLLFIAERGGRPIASSLIALQDESGGAAYGRYWGAMERVDCLHFEACFYQPIAWCIEHGFDRFEGGAQGEHKMARALLPVPTPSAHWVAEPNFAEAIERYLEREGQGMAGYLNELERRTPLRRSPLGDVDHSGPGTLSA